MKLLKLTLENFQGIRNLTIDFPGGCSASIYGDNATGKTTVFNAITWLLFDKASTGTKGFTPKTRGADGELHHLDHSVTAVFQLDGCRVVALQKTLHEVYKKKRGSIHEEFDGHTVDYYVDGVPYKEKEYTATILALCGGDGEMLKMLTVPDYFPGQMDWQARRKILLEVCGDVSDTDIINQTPELAELPTILGGHTVDEYRKIATAQRKDINKRLESIPARIDEAVKAIPNTADSTTDTITKAIEALQGEVAGLTAERTAMQNRGNASAEIQKQITELQAKLSAGKTEHASRYSVATATAEAELLRATTAVMKRKIGIDKLLQEKATVEKEIRQVEALRESLLTEYHSVQAERWDNSKEACPTCGQALPIERVEQMRSDFNLNRSNRLAEINRRGKTEASTDMIATKRALIDRFGNEIAEQQQLLQSDEATVACIRETKPVATRYETTQEYIDLTAEISRLRIKLADEDGCQSEAVAAVDAKIRTTNTAIAEQQQLLTNLAIAEAQRKRIAELEQQEKLLATEYEETEKGLYLCDLFTKAKINALTERINDKFSRVRFQLFTDQLNGGVKEGCEVLIPAADRRLIPYAFANNAARINAGLEIISTLSDHWGIQMPVFVDNAESVTKLAETSTQTIRLVVSENDKQLRIVSAEI